MAKVFETRGVDSHRRKYLSAWPRLAERYDEVILILGVLCYQPLGVGIGIEGRLFGPFNVFWLGGQLDRRSDIRSAIKLPVPRRAIAFLRRESPDWIEKLTRTRGTRRETLFWQSGGGYDRNITAPQTLAKMIDYLHLNPVRQGLVTCAADWRWSSARWYLERVPGPLAIDALPAEWVDLGMPDG